jgi:Stress responsive A/B Barrel Domain
LRHVVVWSLGPGGEAELDGVLADLERLPGQIDEIASLSAGRLLNESSFDAVLCVDVADEAALDRYRAHPAHRPVLERLRGAAAEVVVADYLL